MKIEINDDWIVEHIDGNVYYKVELEYDSGNRYVGKEQEKITIKRYKYSCGHVSGELMDEISCIRGNIHIFKTMDITKIPENINDLLLKHYCDWMKNYKQQKVQQLKTEIEETEREISNCSRIIKELSFLDREDKLKRICDEI